MSAINVLKEDIVHEQILQAALHLFQKYGLRKVTMDDVARSVGKSRSSLYYYYKSRDEIFDAVMDAIILEILDEITREVELATTMKEKIHAFCVTKLKTSKERTSVYQAIEAGMDADEMSSYTRAKNAVHKRIMKLEGDLLKQVLSYGIQTGEVRKLNPEEQDSLVFVLLSSLRGIKREIMLEDDFKLTGAAINTLTHLFMTGIKR